MSKVLERQKLEDLRKLKTVIQYDTDNFTTWEKVIENEYVYPLQYRQRRVINILISILQHISYPSTEQRERIRKLFKIQSNGEYETNHVDMINKLIIDHEHEIRKRLRNEP